MRPRGPSSSSPSNTYVGQVEMQNPQWTHLRRMSLATWMLRSVNWAGEKLVCMLLLSFPDIFANRQS